MCGITEARERARSSSERERPPQTAPGRPASPLGHERLPRVPRAGRTLRARAVRERRRLVGDTALCVLRLRRLRPDSQSEESLGSPTSRVPAPPRQAAPPSDTNRVALARKERRAEGATLRAARQPGGGARANALARGPGTAEIRAGSGSLASSLWAGSPERRPPREPGGPRPAHRDPPPAHRPRPRSWSSSAAGGHARESPRLLSAGRGRRRSAYTYWARAGLATALPWKLGAATAVASGGLRLSRSRSSHRRGDPEHPTNG
jgi:hypothetical protein